MSDNYNRHQEGSDPFNWIKLHPLMDSEIIKNYIFDHAGEGETSLLMALAPEGVEMSRVSENNTWYTGMDYSEFKTHDSIFVKAMIPMYFSSITHSLKEKDWSLADSTLIHLVNYQHKFGGAVIPPQSKIDAEISYNKLQLFKKLFM